MSQRIISDRLLYLNLKVKVCGEELITKPLIHRNTETSKWEVVEENEKVE